MMNPSTQPRPTDALLPHMKLSTLWGLKSNAMTNPFTQPSPTVDAPPHMKLSALWALKSNARRRWPERAPTPGARAPRPKPAITGRTAYKSYVASYSQENSQEIPGFAGLS